MYFDLYAVIPVGVLDGPMVLVDVSGSGRSLSFAPWVRVLRQEATEGDHPFERSRVHALDLVHRAFLAEYLNGHVRPYADLLGERVRKHHEVLATGRGFVPNMGSGSWRGTEARLRPRGPGDDVKRGRLTAGRARVAAWEAVQEWLRRRRSKR